MLDSLEPWLQAPARWLVTYFRLKVTSARRSYTEQLHLYLTQFSNPYPVAPPGKSWHQAGRAFDAVGDPQVLAMAGSVWNRMGGTWHPSDPIHFQA